MELIIPVILFLFLMSIIIVFGHRRFVRPSRVLDQVGSAADNVRSWGAPGVDQPPLPVRFLQQIGQQVPVSPNDVSTQRNYLIAAGFRSEAALWTLYGVKIFATAALLLLSFFVIWPLMPAIMILRIVLLIAAGALGFFGPNLVLEKMVANRQQRLRHGLPDALDLMVVCVESGLGLDQAVMTVSRELQVTHPDISEELSLVNLEMQAGTRRMEALRNFAARTGEDEIRKLVAILIQTDRFGTSMGDSLRTHADFMRVRRRQQAEERAAKVGVKLVFPIFFFILPSMFIVTAGPGVLQVVKYLMPMLRNYNAP